MDAGDIKESRGIKMDKIPIIYQVTIFFIIFFIFSFVSWLDENIKNITEKNKTKMLVRGSINSFIGALVGIVAYAGLSDYYPQMGEVLRISLGALSAVFSNLIRASLESVVVRKFGEKKDD